MTVGEPLRASSIAKCTQSGTATAGLAWENLYPTRGIVDGAELGIAHFKGANIALHRVVNSP